MTQHVSIQALAAALRVAFKRKAGRPPTDIPEMDAAEIIAKGINRANLSKRQRQLTSKVSRSRGRKRRTKNKRLETIVKRVATLHEQGYTLTYTDSRIGSAFHEASKQIELEGMTLTPTAIRNIWQRNKYLYGKRIKPDRK